MTKNFATYSTLKLNGKSYARPELIALSDAKLKDSSLADWEKDIFRFIGEWLDEKEEISVKTSGSTGKPKTILLEKQRMIHSARLTNTFFDLDKTKTALLCLSCEYIAGKMMLVRAFVGGFDLHFKKPASDVLLYLQSDYDFTAVVPLQLETLLMTENFQTLNRIKKMIVGGTSLRSDLRERLDLAETYVWSTYGMTETITHIALQALNGKSKSDYFQALLGVQFQVDERNCLRLIAPAICADSIVTNDRVELIDKQRFRFLGRVDFIINSGGIKLSPEILEQKLALHIEDSFAISSMKDDALGEKVVLVIEGQAYSTEKQKEIGAVMITVLDRFEQPKEIIFVRELPKTSAGKIDRIRLKVLIDKI